MHWTRRWLYELRWAPGHRGGVLSREVDTVAQLRAVVEWARSNPNVIKYSFRPVDHLEGERATRCAHGHRLDAPDPRQPYRWRQDIRRYDCAGCSGHDVTACPTCGERIIEPPPAHGCAAVRAGAATPHVVDPTRRPSEPQRDGRQPGQGARTAGAARRTVGP